MSEMTTTTPRTATPTDGGARPPMTTARPLVDIFEGEGDFLIHAEIPGVSEDQVELTLHEDELLVRAGRPLTRGIDDTTTVLRDELGAVTWERRFRVGASVDPDGVTASLRDGVLSVRLPKSEAARPRRIEVTATA